MAEHNLTLHRYNNAIQRRECMAHICSVDTSKEIFIPESWLNEGLKYEDVDKWVEIGNSLVFPASVEESSVKRSEVEAQSSVNFFYKGLAVEPRDLVDKNDKYMSSLSVRHFASGEIYAIYISNLSKEYLKSQKNKTVQITRILKKSGIAYLPWEQINSFFIRDLQVANTKEPLIDYILRTYDDAIKSDSDDITVKKITIDCKKKTAQHKLAIMSFYRYLWSNRYKNVVKDTLKLISLGISAWDALYCALSKSSESYYYYYSLLSNRGYKSREEVDSVLYNHGFSVNQTFTKSLQIDTPFIWKKTDEELIKEVEDFKVRSSNIPRTELLVCTKPSNTLTNRKAYSCLIDPRVPKKVRTRGNDYIERYYSIDRFS